MLDKSGKFVWGLKLNFIFATARRKSGRLPASRFFAASSFDTAVGIALTLGRSAAAIPDGLRENDVAAVYNFDVKVEQLQDFTRPRPAGPLRVEDQDADGV